MVCNVGTNTHVTASPTIWYHPLDIHPLGSYESPPFASPDVTWRDVWCDVSCFSTCLCCGRRSPRVLPRGRSWSTSWSGNRWAYSEFLLSLPLAEMAHTDTCDLLEWEQVSILGFLSFFPFNGDGAYWHVGPTGVGTGEHTRNSFLLSLYGDRAYCRLRHTGMVTGEHTVNSYFLYL
jgi:hypothetical protein